MTWKTDITDTILQFFGWKKNVFLKKSNVFVRYVFIHWSIDHQSIK